MGNNGRTALLNILTIVVLAATVCLVGAYALMGLNIYNPFPAPTRASLALPTEPPTPSGPTPIPTWTPTHTPAEPSPMPTRTPTLTPSATSTFPPTPTFPPTVTPTPRATRSPWPFTYELDLMSPQYGCSWTGVAGHVQDLDGNPLVGYPVHVWGAGIDGVVTSGSDARFNTIYGNQAAWEQFFDAKPKVFEVRVQLHDPYRDDHLPVSEEIVIEMPGFCGAGLAYVVFTQNH
jgi:hypothetical protein